jgi:broad specificity phosphatase PhoE
MDETGMEQAGLLAEKLRQYPISHIYASPLIRAAVTAQIAAKTTNAPITYMDSLKEIHLGPWEGKTFEEIKSAYPKAFDEWEKDPAAKVGTDIESYKEVEIRAFDALMAIVKKGQDNILIVSHGAWIRALLCKILHIDLSERLFFHTGNTGLTIIEYGNRFVGENNFAVITMNDVSHLKEGAI